MNTTFVREVRINYHGKKVLSSIKEPKDAANFIRKLLPDNSREHFISLYLNGAHEIIAYSVTGTGTANSCPIHPREIFQPAILAGAVAILVAHNHPSGSIEPSAEDRKVTVRLKEVGGILAIKVLDHIIVTDRDYYSFQEADNLV